MPSTCTFRELIASHLKSCGLREKTVKEMTRWFNSLLEAAQREAVEKYKAELREMIGIVGLNN